MKNNDTDLSIIIPVVNEKEHFPITINVLESIVKIRHEIIVVYDKPDDTTIEIVKQFQKKYPNINLVQNKKSFGVRDAISAGIDNAKSKVILIIVIDEIFPIIAINDMYRLITEYNCDFVSGTRYSLGGKRYGGSVIGHILSRLANFLFQKLSGSIISDCTTGIKMFTKEVWYEINPVSNIGWSFVFEMSIKTQMLEYKIGEIPITSVDRLLGGKSTFVLSSWLNNYLKWFFWGLIKINHFNKKQKKAITLKKD